jgi:ABC-type Zn uptake system ZnuABC Zn-binding protein ZnuA
VSDRLAQAIAGETGIRVVRLYSDSLGTAGGEADTYLRMMDSNVQAIVAALR